MSDKYTNAIFNPSYIDMDLLKEAMDDDKQPEDSRWVSDSDERLRATSLHYTGVDSVRKINGIELIDRDTRKNQRIAEKA